MTPLLELNTEKKLTTDQGNQNTWSYSPCNCSSSEGKDVQPGGLETHRNRRRNAHLECTVQPANDRNRKQQFPNLEICFE